MRSVIGKSGVVPFFLFPPVSALALVLRVAFSLGIADSPVWKTC